MMSRGRKADFFGEQLVDAVGDLHAVLDRRGLAVFVKRHDDDRRAVAAHEPRLFEEFLFAFLEADRIDDRFALRRI